MSRKQALAPQSGTLTDFFIEDRCITASKFVSSFLRHNVSGQMSIFPLKGSFLKRLLSFSRPFVVIERAYTLAGNKNKPRFRL